MSDLYLTLKNGMKMPRLGMGTWMLGEHLSIYQQEKKALQAGIDAGFTLIDTAEMYGNGLSEKLIGNTIQGYSREKLFLVSKVYPHNAGRPQIYDSIDQTLHNLKTDYLDMYLLHWRGSIPLEETVDAMEELVKKGKIRSWGRIQSGYIRYERIVFSSQWRSLSGGSGIVSSGIPWDRV